MTREYCLGFMFDPTGKMVVLIQKKRPAWQFGKLNGVGGKIETGEHPEAAMVREFREETGLETSGLWEKKIELFCPEVFTVHIFRCWSSEFQKVRSMTDEPVHIDFAEGRGLLLPRMPNLRWIIPMLMDRGLEGVTRVQDGKPEG